MFQYLQSKRANNTAAAGFNPISQTDSDSESLNSHIHSPKNTDFPTNLRESSITLVTTLFFICSIVASISLGVWIGHSIAPKSYPSSIICDEGYSPLTESITIPHQAVQFNGSLLKENIFRQSSSPAVDAAWQSLGVDYRSVIIPSSLAEKSGLLPSYVQVSPQYGGGFPANVEGLHHLHCLNILRKTMFWNYDYYHALGKGAFKNGDDIVKLHASHCLDILRQQLMCHVDTGVLGQIWWDKSKPQAFPDFNTVHQCKNFEYVRKWAEEHQAPLTVERDYLISPAEKDVLESIP